MHCPRGRVGHPQHGLKEKNLARRVIGRCVVPLVLAGGERIGEPCADLGPSAPGFHRLTANEALEGPRSVLAVGRCELTLQNKRVEDRTCSVEASRRTASHGRIAVPPALA